VGRTRLGPAQRHPPEHRPDRVRPRALPPRRLLILIPSTVRRHHGGEPVFCSPRSAMSQRSLSLMLLLLATISCNPNRPPADQTFHGAAPDTVHHLAAA